MMAVTAALYPSFHSDRAVIAIWYELLRDTPYDVAMRNLKAHAKRSPYPPTVADICARETALSPGMAWKQVLSLIGRYGRYRQAEALSHMPPKIRAAVEDAGYMYLCGQDERHAREEFERIYKQDPEMIAPSPEAALPVKAEMAIEMKGTAEVG